MEVELESSKIASMIFSLAGLMAVAGAVRQIWTFLARPRTTSIFTSIQKAIDPWGGVIDKELMPAISEEVNKLTVVQFRMVNQGICAAITLATALRVTLHDGDAVLSDVQQCLLGGVYFTCSSVTLCPSVVTRRSMDIIYAASVICLCFFVAPFVVVDGGEEIVSMNLAVVLLVAVNFGRLTLTLPCIVLNILFAAGACWSLQTYLRAVALLLFHTMSVCLPFLMARNVRHAVFQSFQLKDAGEMHSAACALLRSCCEVVVEVDADSCVKDHAQDLSRFLLQEKRHCPEGWSLADLISHEDERQALLRSLHESKQQDGLAENMLVSVKDSCNIPLRLELLWFQFSRMSEKRFMVGIREFSDFAGHQTPRSRPEAGATAPEQIQNVEATSSRTSGLTSSIPETLSVTSGASDPPAAMLVDATAEGLPIHSITPEFCLRIGRLALGTKLTEHVKYPQAFAQWVQGAVGDVFNGLDSPAACVTLKMPQGRFHAVCRVLSDTEVALDRVGLVFYRIKRRTAASEESSRHSHGLVNGRGTPSLGRLAPHTSL